MTLIKVRQSRTIYNEYDLQKELFNIYIFLIPKSQQEKDNRN